jgi:hypothetical protein
MPFAFLAGLERMRINSGHLSRTPRGIERTCAAQVEAFERGEIEPEVAYVVEEEPYRRALARSPPMTCGRLDGHVVCVSSARRTPLAEALAASGAESR